MSSVFQRCLWSAFVLALAALAGASLSDSAANAAPKANGKIAFVSFRTGDPEVWTMYPDGSRKTQLTSNAGPFPDLPFLDFWPSWSPDGKKIVFTSFRNFNLDVYTMNQNGTGLTRITRHPTGDLDPAFFPDGRKIVFVRELPGPTPDSPPAAQDIYTVNTDGTGERNLTPGPERETEPAISPDGETIAFEREVGGSGDHEGGNHEIFTIKADGTGLRRLTHTATGREQHPNFSPDGRKIVFDDNFHAPPGVRGAIYTMNVDGSDVTKLTPNRTDRHGLAAYSPDGKKISFTASEDIYVMNADGSGQRPLTTHPAPDIQASWAPAIRCANVRRGSDASETIRGTTLGDNLFGRGGHDTISGRHADDCIRGHSGDDILGGGSGADRVSGASGDDTVTGREGDDRLWGRSGHDKLSGHSGNDRIDGGTGNDKLKGGSGRNRLRGGSGNDRIDSDNGRREAVSCGRGRDFVRADRSDRLRGCERARRR